jgi:hypothetical protein
MKDLGTAARALTLAISAQKVAKPASADRRRLKGPPRQTIQNQMLSATFVPEVSGKKRGA